MRSSVCFSSGDKELSIYVLFTPQFWAHQHFWELPDKTSQIRGKLPLALYFEIGTRVLRVNSLSHCREASRCLADTSQISNIWTCQGLRMCGNRLFYEHVPTTTLTSITSFHYLSSYRCKSAYEQLGALFCDNIVWRPEILIVDLSWRRSCSVWHL